MPQEPRTSHKEVVSGHLDDRENTGQELEDCQFLLLLLNGKVMLLDLSLLEFGTKRYSANHQENYLFLTAKAEQKHLAVRNC